MESTVVPNVFYGKWLRAENIDKLNFLNFPKEPGRRHELQKYLINFKQKGSPKTKLLFGGKTIEHKKRSNKHLSVWKWTIAKKEIFQNSLELCPPLASLGPYLRKERSAKHGRCKL